MKINEFDSFNTEDREIIDQSTGHKSPRGFEMIRQLWDYEQIVQVFVKDIIAYGKEKELIMT